MQNITVYWTWSIGSIFITSKGLSCISNLKILILLKPLSKSIVTSQQRYYSRIINIVKAFDKVDEIKVIYSISFGK